MSVETNGLYEFGEYRLDAKERRLLRGEQPIPLTAKVFDTLLVLVRNGGHLVSKDALLKEVWSDAFVEEANLARHVWTIRKALGDDENEHRYIETIPKIGYRFVVPVRQLDRTTIDKSNQIPSDERGALTQSKSQFGGPTTPISVPPVPADPTKQTHRSRIRRARTVGATNHHRSRLFPCCLFSCFPSHASKIGSADWIASDSPAQIPQWQSERQLPGIGPRKRRHHQSESVESDYGPPYSAIQKYAAQPVDALHAAQELKVDSVLDGTFQADGDRLRVTVNLMRARDGFSLFADSFDVHRTDIFRMQDDLARQIATRLRITLRETNTTTAHPDPSAYDLYFKAKYHAGLLNPADNDQAIELLQQAIKIDPNFAAAYADLATEYRNKNVSLHALDREWEEKALSAVTTALRLDPDLPEAHLSNSLLLWTPSRGFPHSVAIAECRRAIELNPDFDEAHHQLANMYNHIGLLDKANEEVLKALEINPANVGARFRVGVNLTYQAKFEQALTAFGDQSKFSPHLWSYQVAYVLFELGRKQESSAIVDKYLKELPQDEGGTLTSMKALLAASNGDTKAALENIKRAAEIGKDYIHFHHTEYTIASAYALMNNHTQAMEWLKKTAADGFPCYPLFEKDPNLKNLKDDTQFKAFMTTLKEQWERYKATL
jgi:DNA-binding winged helix-turn-helix (wHTH) protein/tetratricopeptide (TPR) repeat protein